MQEKRTRVPSHGGVTKFKRDGKVVGYRAQVIDPRTSKKVSANTVVNGARGEIFPLTKQGYRDACWLCWQAEDKLGSRTSGGAITVPQLREQYMARTHGKSGPLKESTQISNAERTKRFAADHAKRRVDSITDTDARDWAATAASGEREAVKSMFNFAVDQRMVDASPFRSVSVQKGRGNEEVDPPTPAQVDRLVAAAQKILPSWGAWLCFGRWVGTRPGETDMLRFSDFESDFCYVRIRRQWNQKAGRVTSPKHNRTHKIAVPREARAIVKAQLAAAVRRQGEVFDLDTLVFTNTRGTHFTQTSRAYYWKATTAASGVTHTDAGETVTPYLATRHFCGWYMTNVLNVDAADVAHQLRHGDGGILVRQLYGHRSADLAARDNLARFDEAA
jgi:integrase